MTLYSCCNTGTNWTQLVLQTFHNKLLWYKSNKAPQDVLILENKLLWSGDSEVSFKQAASLCIVTDYFPESVH